MIAENLLSKTFVPLRSTDTGREALTIMNIYSVRHLPVVDHTHLINVLSEDDILANDIEAPVASYKSPIQQVFVHTYDHIYEVMRILAERNLTVIPVVNEKEEYVGMVTQEDLLKYFAGFGAFAEPGSIVVLTMNKRDYSLSEISRIVESEHATILSAFISNHPDSNRLDVTLKLNTQNDNAIIKSFERFDYEVKASFRETEYLDTLQERYDALMSFLNV